VRREREEGERASERNKRRREDGLYVIVFEGRRRGSSI
jgi:hypothetical protein